MRAVSNRIKQVLNFDQLGISLSFLCAIHCLLMPFVLVAVPVLGHSFQSPWVHAVLAVFILPVGLWAFIEGYKHHKRLKVFLLGIPGLLIVAGVPFFLPEMLNPWTEPLIMTAGSSLIISAHWLNRKSCACEIHGHK